MKLQGDRFGFLKSHGGARGMMVVRGSSDWGREMMRAKITGRFVATSFPLFAVTMMIGLIESFAIGIGATRSSSAGGPGIESRKRSVLFIAVDDLACRLGCYGDGVAKTPHIDALAASGVCFERAYTQIPLCNPSRASLMTGMRPDRTKVYDLERHFRDEQPEAVTLPQRFRAAGYRTVRFGKVFHYDVPGGIGTDGLDDVFSWDERYNPSGRDRTDEAMVTNAEPGRPISAALSWLAAEGADDEQTDGMVATGAIEWLDRHGDQPFFLAVGFFRPHTPFVAPRKYFELYPEASMRLPFSPDNDRDDIPLAAFAHNCAIPNYGLANATLIEATRAYYASVSFVDAQIGRLLAALKASGLADKTLVVLWSDHGYHLGEHQGVWQKRTLFEESARSPLLIRMPGAGGNGRSCRRVVEFVDLYPTVLEAAGLDAADDAAIDPAIDGRSLVPLLDDPDRTWESFAVTQILRPQDARLNQPVMGCSVRTERYRYTEWGEGAQGVELYDHQSDPGEFRNLAIRPTDHDAALMRTLQRELRQRGSGEVPRSPFNPKRL